MENKNPRFHICETKYQDGKMRALPIEDLMRTKNAYSDWIRKQPWSVTIERPGLLFSCDNYYLAGHEALLDTRLKVMSINNGGINGLSKE